MPRERASGDEKRTSIAMRILPSELDEIGRRAKRLNYSRTDYMIRAALGQILDPDAVEARLQRLEREVFPE